MTTKMLIVTMATLACAAGVATLEVYEEDRLIENAARVGRYLGQRLEQLDNNRKAILTLEKSDCSD